MRITTLAFTAILATLAALGGADASGSPTVAVVNSKDGEVARKPAVQPDSRAAVRESDTVTNTDARAIEHDDAHNDEIEAEDLDHEEAAQEDVPAANKLSGPSGKNPAGDPVDPAHITEGHADDAGFVTAEDENAADAADVENDAAGAARDHEVEPEEEGGEEGEEFHDEEERDAEEEGGEEGDEEEEEGSEEAEEDHHTTQYAENDEEEFDDDPKTASRGVDAKDFDWNPKDGRVTSDEMDAARELHGEHFDGDGNRDVKDLRSESGNKVDVLNKDLASKLAGGRTEMEKLRAVAAAKAAQDPGAANEEANGQKVSAYTRRTGKKAPRKTPVVVPPLALLKSGTAKLPTAKRLPTPLPYRPDSVLRFDWRGGFDGHTFAKIPHSDAMNSESFALTFWLTVHAGKNDTKAWRSVLHKGFTNFQRTPSMWLEYGSNRLYAAVSTTYSADETVTTKRSLTPGVPAHVAYVVRGRNLEVYIDGVLEAERALRGDVLSNTGPLYLGKDPFYRGADVDMHSFEWHARPLGSREIRATSQRTRESVVASFDRKGSFDGGSLSTLSFPHLDQFNTDEFSVSFWATLRSHGSGMPRAILHKGMDDSERTPYIALDAQRNRLNVRVSTTSHPSEGFFSKAELRINQPTHITYVRRAKELSLYIDGVLDTQVSTRGHTEFNDGAVFLGNSPFADGFDGDISGFRWSRRAFTDREVLTVLRGTADAPIKISTSSAFGPRDYIRTPHIAGVMDAPDATISMWISPSQGPTGKWRSIFHKGRNTKARTPSLWLHPKTMQVVAEVSLARSVSPIMRVVSKRTLHLKQVQHVAVTIKGSQVCILIEGWVDVCRRTPSGSRIRVNRGNMMIGKSSRFPGFTGSITDIRYHPRALPRSEVSPYEMDIPEGVYSYWNPALGDHVLSLNKRVYGEGLHGYQIISNGESVGAHGTGKGHPIGFAHNIAGKYLVPLYEFFNDRTGDHSYTTDASAAPEGYEPMGINMYVYPPNHKIDASVVPVYKHFNAKLGDTFFTTDAKPGHGYVSQGVAFVLHKDGSVAVPVREYYDAAAGGGATLALAAPVQFSGWDKMTTSDLGYLTPSKDFSVAFWLKLDSDGRGFYRTILHHGFSAEQRSPAVYLMPHEPRLAVRLSTGVDFNNGLDSRTVLPIGQFTHVVISSQGNILTLYINGEVDATHTFTGHRSFNAGPFHIGRFPDSPGVEGTVGGFTFFDHTTTVEDARRLMLGDMAKPELALTLVSTIEAAKPVTVPHAAVFDSESFTAIIEYVLVDMPQRGEHERVILWKGNNKDESTPSMVVTADGKILVRLSTAANQGAKDAFMISSTALVPNKVYRLALVRDGDTVKLMINGRLDKSMDTKGAILFNNGPLSLGGVSWATEGKESKTAGRSRVISFKWFGRTMSLREILQFNDSTDRRGAVARFDWRGRLGLGKHAVLPGSSRFSVKGDFTVSMFLTRSFSETRKWRAFALRGEAHFYRSPMLQIFPATGRVRATVHLKGSVGEYISIESVSTVPFYTPTHIALIKTGPFLRLLIDGVPENSLHVGDAMFPVSNDPLSFGNLDCHVSRAAWFNRALTEAEVLEEVYTA